MGMYGIPLAPHEIDQLPNAERIVATIEQAESDMEMACEELHAAGIKEAMDQRDEYYTATVDLWHSLKDLVRMVEDGHAEAELPVARLALERNNDLTKG